jgi:carbonic anhydrase
VVFDQPAGSLFVVRIAGNTASPSALASLDYAVGELGVELLVVMGHTNCGAVGAAAEGVCQGRLEPILDPICELAREHPDLEPDTLSALNVARTMATLRADDGPAGRAAADGRLAIRGAVHDVASGELTPVELDATGAGRAPAGRG